MNYIEINGGNKDQKIFTKQIIEWCIEDLLPRVRTLDITVEAGVHVYVVLLLPIDALPSVPHV